MKPKIGITTSAFSQKDWPREIKNSRYKTIEIAKRRSNLPLDPSWIEKVRPFLEGFDLSMHSGTAKVFSENEQFTKTELNMLKSEIIICQMFGINELVFHLKHDKLSAQEAEHLQEIVDFAKKRDVQMIYESNGIIVAEVALDLLQRFPDVNYNLDLGHLNNGFGRGMLGCSIDEFISKVKDRVVYVHAHNNSGKKDEHIALRDGTLDWQHVLASLDMSIVKKIIMEVKTTEDTEKTEQDLKSYFENFI